MNEQPKALYLLNFASMWEYFSYYGMRVLLVLYMVQELQFSDGEAFIFYAIYTTLAEIGGLVGGYIADRFLGLKRSVILGGWIIAAGHIALAISYSLSAFVAGLALIILGTALFRTNMAALLGTFYDENDPRRDAGYTLYYTGINVGGFLASIFCGLVAEWYGWHAGFSIAAIGMIAGNIVLIGGSSILARHGERQSIVQTISVWENIKAVLLGKTMMVRIGLCLLFLVLFYSFEEQIGSTLILFSERYVDRETIWGTIPAATLITFNPLSIILIGPLVSRLLRSFYLNALTKMSLGFAFLGAAFCTLYMGCMTVSANETVPLAYAIGSIIFIALGEIFMGPTLYSEASKGVPASLAGITMGLVTVGFSLANLVSGLVSIAMTISEETATLSMYAGGFGIIALLSLSLAGVIIGLNKTKTQKVFA